jgi:MFS family permease
MLVLDDTIANIALPSIQGDLGVPTTVLPWIVSAYVLTFGALLLFGGRLGDLYGRRRILRAGLGVFIRVSLVASQLSEHLLVCRASLAAERAEVVVDVTSSGVAEGCMCREKGGQPQAPSRAGVQPAAGAARRRVGRRSASLLSLRRDGLTRGRGPGRTGYSEAMGLAVDHPAAAAQKCL